MTELNRRDRALVAPVFEPREQGRELRARAAAPAGPGALLLAEIREQPAALRRLLEHAATSTRPRRGTPRPGLELVRMVGHGSSDNAASYGVYAFGLLPGWTAMRDSISLSVYYGAQVDLRGSMRRRPIAVRGRRRTCSSTSRARRRGAFTIGISNERLAARDDGGALLPLAPAPSSRSRRRTYLAQVAALALLAGHAAGRGAEVATGSGRTADLLEELLPELERRVSELAVALAFVGRMFVIGRGPEFATAREISLKLLETCRVAAEPLTATDLVHGPVARARRSLPRLDDRLGGRACPR